MQKLLHSHENAHAIFTLCSQAAMGATLWVIAAQLLNLSAVKSTSGNGMIPMIAMLLVLLTYGLIKLNLHLGKPQFFYRGYYNLRWSPVSREIAGVTLFVIGLMMMLFVEITGLKIFEYVAYGVTIIGFALGSYYMYKLYRIPARPFWDHWQTGSAFYGTALSLGSLVFGLLLMPFGLSDTGIMQIASIAMLGLALESIGHIVHRQDVKKFGESQASYFEQVTTFGKTYQMRNTLLGVNMAIMAWLMMEPSALLFAVSFVSVLVSAYLGRILFYALVIPTTMPGGFFWKNDKFKEHAIETGLSDMPQMGVMADRHHKFDVKALVNVIKQTTIKEAFMQIKSIVRGG
jgi:DMSO reductase anchor subunit